MPELVLGPILRHVDTSSATVWVQTDGPCTVEVAGCSAKTFQVGAHHFALVVITGLAEGSTPYQVHLDGEQVWPLDGAPASRIRVNTSPDFTVIFGSCRMPESDDPRLGRDAIAAYAERMSGQDSQQWPDSLVLLGDQVYADEPTEATKQWLRDHRHGTHEPDGEVVHFSEYARLYHETWGDPEIRWLLSVVPSSMIFDDHDVRDDWNTSAIWKQEMAGKPWWRNRIRGALASYWVYQHLGNLGPDELARDPLYAKVKAQDTDVLALLEDFAEQADSETGGSKSTWWSFRRDFGRARLLMIDTRCGRILEDGKRQMVSDDEFELDRTQRRRRLRPPADRLVAAVADAARAQPFPVPQRDRRAQSRSAGQGWPRRSGRRSISNTGRRSASRSTGSPG